MNKPPAILFLAASILLALPLVHAEPAKPAPSPAASVPSLRQTYDSFRLVHTRNVFDPDRRPVRPATNTPNLSPTTRADYAALTGTMLSADKSYAFFSGSRPEFNKVLVVREKIANATIAGITALNIEIERDGKRTTVAVGQTVPFDNQTAPGVPPVEAPETAPSTTTAASTPATSPGATTPAAARPLTGATTTASTAPKGPPANLDEIRRRMMEKRQQELK